MNKIQCYLKDNFRLLISLSVMIILIFGVYLIGKDSFVLGYDFQYQHLFFYQDFHRLIKSGQMPFWSNNIFLGTDFWSSKSYYILGDPFAYLTLLFDSENMINALLFTYILKFITAALLFNQLLTYFNIRKEVRFIPVLMYTFCGWATLFAEHPMFLVWHTFLPLLLIGIEKALQKNKYSTFIIGVFLVFVSNYYFFWTTSVFMTFYWTIRYYVYKDFKFKEYFLDTLKLIGYYLVGCMMAMILITPSILHLVGSNRVSNSSVPPRKWNPVYIYLDILVKFFIAPYKVSELGQMLFNTTDYATNQLSLYSSILTVVLLPQVLTLKKKERNGYLSLLFILSCLLITPWGASLMHGFKEPTFRWTLLFITSNIIIVSLIVNDFKNINKKLLVLTIILIGICVFGLRFAATKHYDWIWDHLLPEYNGLLAAFILSILYASLIVINKKYSILLIALIFIGEVSYGSYKTLKRYPDFEYFKYEGIIDEDAIAYVKSLEDENAFYRIYVPYSDIKTAMPHNVNLYYDYKSGYTYDSLYQFTLNDFIENDMNITWTTWQLDIRDLDLFNKLNFKYFLVTNPEFIVGNPRTTDKSVNLNEISSFKLLTKINDYYVYQNMDAEIFPLDLEIDTDNKLKGTVIKSDNGLVILPIAYDEGWKIKVNGQKTDLEKSSFISFNANLNDVVELSFTPSGFIAGTLISLGGSALFIYIYLKERKS